MCENKMDMEINDTVLQNLNRYLLISLTYKRHCTCLTNQQWSVQRANNWLCILTGTAAKCQKVLARTHRVVPRCLPQQKRRDKLTQVGKRMI